jgi:hypothetical protein
MEVVLLTHSRHVRRPYKRSASYAVFSGMGPLDPHRVLAIRSKYKPARNLACDQYHDRGKWGGGVLQYDSMKKELNAVFSLTSGGLSTRPVSWSAGSNDPERRPREKTTFEFCQVHKTSSYISRLAVVHMNHVTRERRDVRDVTTKTMSDSDVSSTAGTLSPSRHV